ncbi:MAG TPA: hypothetical protein VF903_02960, partial [Nitrospirota bacterium]
MEKKPIDDSGELLQGFVVVPHNRLFREVAARHYQGLKVRLFNTTSAIKRMEEQQVMQRRIRKHASD